MKIRLKPPLKILESVARDIRSSDKSNLVVLAEPSIHQIDDPRANDEESNFSFLLGHIIQRYDIDNSRLTALLNDAAIYTFPVIRYDGSSEDLTGRVAAYHNKNPLHYGYIGRSGDKLRLIEFYEFKSIGNRMKVEGYGVRLKDLDTLPDDEFFAENPELRIMLQENREKIEAQIAIEEHKIQVPGKA